MYSLCTLYILLQTSIGNQRRIIIKKQKIIQFIQWFIYFGKVYGRNFSYKPILT